MREDLTKDWLATSYEQSAINTDKQICWICLDEENADMLISVCQCKSKVHQKCIALWQFHSYGTKDEKYCRFCNSSLPLWKEVLPHLRYKAKLNISALLYRAKVCIYILGVQIIILAILYFRICKYDRSRPCIILIKKSYILVPLYITPVCTVFIYTFKQLLDRTD